MWMLLLFSLVRAGDKPEGELPEFADSKPVISCCVEKAIVDRAVRDRLDEVRACHTDTPGRGSLYWAVAPSGAVEDVQVSTGDAERDTCLAAVVETFVFPALPCRLAVVYPLIFAAAP